MLGVLGCDVSCFAEGTEGAADAVVVGDEGAEDVGADEAIRASEEDERFGCGHCYGKPCLGRWVVFSVNSRIDISSIK